MKHFNMISTKLVQWPSKRDLKTDVSSVSPREVYSTGFTSVGL